MSRIRSVKPEFWGHAKTARVSRDARLLFIGLLNESDDEGRQIAAPRRIAGTLFPHDEDVSTGHVKRWLEELEQAHLISRYEVNGVAYLLICGFLEHQKINRPTKSRLPGPCESSVSPPEPVSEPSPPDLGSRIKDLGSRIIAPEEPAREESVTVEVAAPRDLLWDAVMVVCGVDTQITNGARGAYNKAVKDLRGVNADPDEVKARAVMFRVKWPDISLTPTALARHWAELEPSGENMPGRRAPKSLGALARVAQRDT